MHKVLVIDDDERLRELLTEYLGRRGFAVSEAVDGAAGLELLTSDSFDAVVLDVMMPGMDGFEVMRAVRRDSTIPVIMLTARGDEIDRIVGLELGADDYLPKPFNPRELVARLNAVLRRTQPAVDDEESVLVAGPLRVDPSRREVTLRDERLVLTTTEFDILRVLVARAGRVVPRERLMELARGEDYASFDRSVDVHISRIRRKLGEDPRDPRLLKTVRGVGYTIARDAG